MRDLDRGDTPCSSAFDEVVGCFARAWKNPEHLKQEFKADLSNLDDDADEVGGEDSEGDADGEGRTIGSCVGMDPTLDREEEDNDRKVIGKEDAGNRMYMREVLDSDHYLNFNAVVPELYDDSYETRDFDRDPRADHIAVRARLSHDNFAEQGPQSPIPSEQAPPVNLQVKAAENGINLRPILKGKESRAVEKPKKRVRYDSGCKDDHGQFHGDTRYAQMAPQSMDSVAGKEEEFLHLGIHGVPDCIRKSSKYTCYGLDTPDYGDDDETNNRALEDFGYLAERSNPDDTPSELLGELPGFVSFIP